MPLALATSADTSPTLTSAPPRPPRTLILWGNRKVIHQRAPAVTQARHHPRLEGLPMLARGVYTLVFDGGHTVVKLTMDGVAYRLAEHQANWCCPGLPVTVALHGQVGVSQCGAPLWLFEQERLVRLPAGSEARKHALQVGRLLRKGTDHCRSDAECLETVVPGISHPHLAEAVQHLAGFASSQQLDYSLDMHASNFMMRSATGSPVITDPFIDCKVLDMVQQHIIRTEGLPANTLFI